MSDIVIRAENLGKHYLIGHETDRERYTALRDVVGRSVKGMVRSAKDMLRGSQLITGDEVEEFWALQDVNFEVRRGEVVGIIGRNGAGKSTLLKILSRITEPSAGRVEIKGRVASLLEVGTGFHPELTGRENIFLNGAILGMSRSEIKRKFDEIVAFAEVEKFLDTPVKRYSSGMYVRLAFAVAAHLEPEILVVDEVLAVGDVEFQKKCLGKMQSVAAVGRTVLFVSHNIGAIKSLCSSAALLREGRMEFRGSTSEAISMYLNMAANRASTNDTHWRRTGSGQARVRSIAIRDGDGNDTSTIGMGGTLEIEFSVEFLERVTNPIFGVNVVTATGVRVADCRTSHYDLKFGVVEGVVTVKMRMENVLLYPRLYFVDPWVTDAACLSNFDWVESAAEFEVLAGHPSYGGTTVTADHGIVFLPTSWMVKNEECHQ
ncbi:ABC transporter ATP-binding protein [Rhodomicrobium sp. Az07]|uniref:ABC transporter ATP-binding protein n=1 Tax=Rhodomicrobium sp. Az07 TaxID=2839034 RepID=UPI001BEB6E64|nr:ABC transporter ATP-binding protein [Rhodomicrobium sp. Az07]MBT3069777.1 ABC transporter ATP-binding protein [Rhodomicrobium sp. Az07]